MRFTACPTAFLLLLLGAPMPSPAGAQPADKPALRSSLPTHVEAPCDQAAAARPPRAVQRTAADVKDTDREKININSADVKQLMALNGVGRKMAERIVAYRESHGPFKKASELRKVEGVDDALWEKNRTRIVVR